MCMAEKYCQDILNNRSSERYCKERASSEGKARAIIQDHGKKFGNSFLNKVFYETC